MQTVINSGRSTDVPNVYGECTEQNSKLLPFQAVRDKMPIQCSRTSTECATERVFADKELSFE
jgi:hypothetical protein